MPALLPGGRRLTGDRFTLPLNCVYRAEGGFVCHLPRDSLPISPVDDRMTLTKARHGTNKDWYLYLVRCRDGSLYTGITTDVDRRFKAHQEKAGAKYLKGRGPLRLVFQERIGAKHLAFQVEHAVKRWPKSKKEQLVHAGRGCLEWVAKQ